MRRSRPGRGRSGFRLPFDPLGAVGILLLIGLWFLLVPFVSRSALPTPWGVVDALVRKFWHDKTFAFYGLVDTGFFSALVYTIENVLMAVIGGSVVGIVAGL